MSVGGVAGTERRCKTRGLSDNEMMVPFKGCRRPTGTWEPVYLSCTVHTGMPHAKSPDLMARGTPRCSLPSSTSPGLPQPVDVSTWPLWGPLGGLGRRGARGREGLGFKTWCGDLAL